MLLWKQVLGKMPQKVFPMQRIYKQTPKALDRSGEGVNGFFFVGFWQVLVEN